MTINTVDATIAAAEAGVGLANVLSYRPRRAIAAGRLVRVLADHVACADPGHVATIRAARRCPQCGCLSRRCASAQGTSAGNEGVRAKAAFFAPPLCH